MADFFDRLRGGAIARTPQPGRGQPPPPEVRAQLEELTFDPSRPVVAVDADEVILLFADHLARYAESQGVRLRLTSYRLDGAFTRISDGATLTNSEGWAVIDAFFASEARRQELVAGAAAGLAGLAEMATVLVLTNVPAQAKRAREANLRDHGLDYPVIANSGGKGRALNWIWERTRRPVAFIDDSDKQLGSAARHAPGTHRVHFVGDPALRRFAEPSAHAAAHPESWPEIVAHLSPVFDVDA